MNASVSVLKGAFTLIVEAYHDSSNDSESRSTTGKCHKCDTNVELF